MFRSFDAAYPPLSPYPGTAAVLGYIGGNTPHVWTPEEWRRFAHLRQAPIWVYGHGQDAAGSAHRASGEAYQLGWTESAPGSPGRRFIVLDMETMIAPSWVTEFARELSGYDCVVYGSAAFVGQNPREDGYWEADWNGQAGVPPWAVAHQYQANVPFQRTLVDLSSWDESMLVKFGYGPRKG